LIYRDDLNTGELAALSAEEARALKEEALRQAVKELEHRVEEEMRRRAAEHTMPQQAEDPASINVEGDAWQQPPEETSLRPEEEARFRIEYETLRHAAEELAQQRVEAARLEAEEQQRIRNEAESTARVLFELTNRLKSSFEGDRASALFDLARIGGDEAFRAITGAFDDGSPEVRNAAARALFEFQPDRAASFTAALRQGSQDRRRRIGIALAESGLAREAIGNLMAENRETTYDAFSVLFLMAKAGEVKPLMRAIEELLDVEARLAVVKLLALSEQAEIVPAFRRLAVRGSLPSEVRSAVMEAIYQISSQTSQTTP
jgi:HEAT repeats